MRFSAIISAAMGFCLLAIVQGCTPPDPGTGVQDITPADAQGLIQQHQGDAKFVILDVRTAAEFAGGHIENAVNVAWDPVTFGDAIAALDKTNTYLVYCGTDHRSPLAVAAMQEQGFTSLYDLTGGLVRWKSEGYPVVQ